MFSACSRARARRLGFNVALLGLLLALVIGVPYLSPTAPAVSLSYVTQFNNKVAVLLLLACSLLYAWLTENSTAEAETAPTSSRLSRSLLLAALALVLLLSWAHLFQGSAHHDGGEAFYNINRVQSLLAGKHMYRDFEYAYGPVNIVVPQWIAELAGASARRSYYLWWTGQWLLGVLCLWALVRLLEPLRFRNFVFLGSVLWMLPAMDTEGMAYTPVRLIGAALLLVIPHAVWRRYPRPWLTAAVSLLSIAAAFAISAEQGLGVTLGLLGWLWLRALFLKSTEARGTAAVVSVGTALLMLACLQVGYFTTAKEFSNGAYNLPLTPSFYVCFLLLTYLAAVVACYNAVRRRDFETQTVLLAIGGITMLPAAFGRADLGHLLSASPALYAGIVYIQRNPLPRRCWNTMYLALFFLPGLLLFRHEQLPRIKYAIRMSDIANSARTTEQVQDGWNPTQMPCRERYRTVDIAPGNRIALSQSCIDPGYYFGLINVLTPAAIDRKIAYLDRTPRQPLLLNDFPLQQQFPTIEADPRTVRALQHGLVTVPVRHAPVTDQPIRDYIEANYFPEDHPTGAFRVWRPKRLQ